MPRRARYLVPRGLPRRDEILAVCVVLAVLVHLLFAQLTIILAAVFYLVTKLTRWRLSWLVIPAAAGLAWTATGAGAAVAGYTAGAARIASYLGERGHQAGHLLHFTGAYAGIGTWLPRQLAAVCAAAGATRLVFGGAGEPAGAGGPADAAAPAAAGAARARAACYEPFRHGSPGQRAALIATMLSWDGPGRQYRRSCVS